MAQLRDPGFPIAVAESSPLETYNVLALIALGSDDFQEALNQMLIVHRCPISSSCWKLELSDHICRLVFVQPGDLRLGQRCDHEFSLAEMTQLIRRAGAGEHWSPLELHFQHDRPPSLGRHQAFFAAPLVFGAARTELVMRTRDLRLSMMQANRLLSDLFERHAQKHFEDIGDVPDDILRIRNAIVEDMRGRMPCLPSVAARITIGSRTLRRRLDEHGLSFRALLDQTRRELAQQYLEGSRHSLAEIAYLLGFSQPSAFHRAFKRWTQEAPLQYRERIRRKRAS